MMLAVHYVLLTVHYMMFIVYYMMISFHQLAVYYIKSRLKQRIERWINSDVLHCIQERDKAFSMYKKDKNEENLKQIKKFRNQAESVIFEAKNNYFT